MPTPYIPARDAEYNAWLANFAATISANPSLYGFTPSDATLLTGLSAAFSAALEAATNPATRTPVTVQAKDSERASGEAVVRTYAFRAIANPSIPPADLVAAGLNPRNFTPSPIPAPTTLPLLQLVRLAPGVSEIAYADSTSPSLKRKPAGVMHLQVVGGASPQSAPTAPTLVLATRTPFILTWGAPGSVTLFGRWVTRRGLVGPWSAALSFNVP